jgi:uncharacterized protein (TIGR02145 family)
MKRKFKMIANLIIIGNLIMFSSCKKDKDPEPTPLPTINTVTDIDGNVYNTVTIGTQVWMKENLRVTHYRNGDSIPLITESSAWYLTYTGAYCDYDSIPPNSSHYGHLYNWYTVVDSRNIAPHGWHVPTNSEWDTLRAYLGGVGVTGGKLKETGTTHWQSPNAGATNESGFTALPCGSRSFDGIFYDTGIMGYWWSTTEQAASYAWMRHLYYNSPAISDCYFAKRCGFSVRCIKD